MPYNTKSDLLSSPDPLNDTPAFSSPEKRQCVPRPQKSHLLLGNSPRKQVFELDVGDQISPHKIKVTVEAEHSEKENDSERFDKNSVPSSTPHRALAIRRNERTTTTIVPVKGLSDNDDDSLDASPRSGRGRLRKSTDTLAPLRSNARPATPGAKPTGRRRRTLGGLVDGDDEEDWDFAIGSGVEVNRRKTRSRPKKGAAQSKAAPSVTQPDSSVKEVSSATNKKGRGRRKTLGPGEVMVFEDSVRDSTSINHRDIGLSDNDDRSVIVQKKVPTSSTFSTIRSTTTAGDDSPDVLLAIFDQAKSTPIKTGWSSPRVMGSRSDIHSELENKASSPQAALPGREKQLAGENDVQRVGIECEKEVDNTLRELQEFDTILESEGFSMISVESVSSLRQNFSSPLEGLQNNEKVKEIDEGTEDSFVEEPRIPEAIIPHTRVSNSNLLFPRVARRVEFEDSFSSIPPEILEAATPGRSLKNRKFSSPGPADRGRTEEPSPVTQTEIPKSAISRKEGENKKPLSIQANHLKVNDDSFSSVPSAILEAATPAKYLALDSNLPEGRSRAESSSTAIEPLLVVPTESVASSTNQNLPRSRLLTPDETPSPPRETSQPRKFEPYYREGTSQSGPSLGHVRFPSVMDLHAKPSPSRVAPKRYTYTAHLRQHRMLHPDVAETPSIVFSSPSLPPLLQRIPPRQAQVQEQVSAEELNGQSEPVLSPIVLAGRALQDITAPSSSRSNVQNLRSPFKSPLSQKISAGASGEVHDQGNHSKTDGKPTEHKGKRFEDDIFGGFSDDTRRELRKSLMMGEELSRSQPTNAQLIKEGNSTSQEDPFTSGQGASNEQYSYRLELLGQNLVAYPEIHGVAGGNDALHSDGAMSWQPENTVPVTRGAGELENLGENTDQNDIERYLRREAEWARERTTVIQQVEAANKSQVIVISSESNQTPGGDEDEEDIWQAEARNSSSLQSVPRRDVQKEKSLERPRRSKIPSSWRKNSKRLVYSDELVRSSSPPSIEKSKATSKQESVKDLTNLGKLSYSQTCTESDVLEPSMVWHIPQKSNFTPQPRRASNLDLSALLASSPIKESSQESHEVEARDAPLLSTLSRKVSVTTNSKVQSQKVIDPAANIPVGKQVKDIVSSPSQGNNQGSAINYSTCSTGANESDPETPSALEGSQTGSDASIHYPSFQTQCLPFSATSPAKSSLRDPNIISPGKSVAFVSKPISEAAASPPASPTLLAANLWSKAHWQLLDSFYQNYKARSPYRTRGSEGGERSKYLGKRIVSQGSSLVLEQWHLDIVAQFSHDARVAPGWDEGVVAKRLFAIIIAEERRVRGGI